MLEKNKEGHVIFSEETQKRYAETDIFERDVYLEEMLVALGFNCHHTRWVERICWAHFSRKIEIIIEPHPNLPPFVGWFGCPKNAGNFACDYMHKQNYKIHIMNSLILYEKEIICNSNHNWLELPQVIRGAWREAVNSKPL